MNGTLFLPQPGAQLCPEIRCATEYLLQRTQPETWVQFHLAGFEDEDDDEDENEAHCRAKLRRPPLSEAAQDRRVETV